MSHLIFILRLFSPPAPPPSPPSPLTTSPPPHHPLPPPPPSPLHRLSAQQRQQLTCSSPVFFFLTCYLTFCLSHPPSPLRPSPTAIHLTLLISTPPPLPPSLPVFLALIAVQAAISHLSGGSRDQGQIELGHWSAVMAHRLRGQSGHLCRD